MYQKNPEYACEKCRKTFKNERALKAHNRSLHQVDDEKPIQRVRSNTVVSIDRNDSRRDPVRDVDQTDS